MRRYCAVLQLSTLAWGVWLSAADIPAFGAADTTVVPGKRVGPITAYSSLAVLQALYGKANVVPKMQTLPSGDTSPGARLFGGTDKQIDLLWEEDGRGKRITEVRIVGGAWALENGLKTGLALADAERLIGKPVRGTLPDGEGGTLASIDPAIPGAGFGVVTRGGQTVTLSAEPRRAASSKKTPPPAQAPIEVRQIGNAVVTKVVIWFR